MRVVDGSIGDRRLNWKLLPFPCVLIIPSMLSSFFFIPSIHLTRVTVNDTFGVVPSYVTFISTSVLKTFWSHFCLIHGSTNFILHVYRLKITNKKSFVETGTKMQNILSAVKKNPNPSEIDRCNSF